MIVGAPKLRHCARFVAVAAMVLAMAGCAIGQRQLDDAADIPDGLSPFDQALYRGYLEVAAEEVAEQDWRDGETFYLRAQLVAAGETVEPEDVAFRDLPEDQVQPMIDARVRLMRALTNGAKEFAPDDAARAQARYDCLMQELEENRQPEDMEACRAAFLESLERAEAQLQGAMVVLLEPPDQGPSAVTVGTPDGEIEVDDVGEGTIARTGDAAPVAEVEDETVGEVFGEALEAEPDDPVHFTLYFEPGTSVLTEESEAQLPEIAALAASRPVQSVIVTGHTDTVGAPAGNVALSTRRAELVRQALIAAGIEADAIDATSLGESSPVVPTADNVDEPRNRRVEVSVQ